MVKPAFHIDWLTGNSDIPSRITEPSEPLKLDGYSLEDEPASKDINWIFYYTDLWNKWSEEQIDVLNAGGALPRLVIKPQGISQPTVTLGADTETSIRSGSIASDLTSVCFSLGLYVAVLALNKIIYSSDGLSWTIADLSAFTISQINEVRFLNNKFIAVGDDDVILYSEDGVTWLQASVPALSFTYRVRGVAGENGVFAACGQKRILSSSDGITWFEETQSVDGLNLISIEYGNGIWVAVGVDASFADAIIYTSTDLVTWTSQTPNYGSGASLERVRFHAGIFNAVGRGLSLVRPSSIRSYDGVTWSTSSGITSSGQARDLAAYGGTWLMAVGDSPARIFKSTDEGATWVLEYTLSFNDYLYGITKGPDGFLAVSGVDGSSGPHVIAIEAEISPDVVEGDIHIDSNNGSTYKIIQGIYNYLFNFVLSDKDATVRNLQINGQMYSGVEAITSPGSTETINWDNGNVQSITLNANCTLTFTGDATGAGYVLIVKQDATGSRTITWPASVKWAGGVAPTLTTTANATDVVSLLFDGTDYLGNIAKAFA